MTCEFDWWEKAMQYMILVANDGGEEFHGPAHRVPIVMVWMVTKTLASVLWLRRPGGGVYQTRQ